MGVRGPRYKAHGSPLIQGMHAELSLAEISPAVRLDSLKHHCCRKCIHEGAVEDCGGPISVSLVIAPPESLLDARCSVLDVHFEK